MRSLLAVGLASVSLTFTTAASAADPAPVAETVVEPAPGQAAASAPSPSAIPITATCTLGDRTGVDEAEAKTAADIICHELAKRGATNTNHEVRFGKLGGKTLLTVAARNGNAYDEARTFINGMDEVEVAGPRLVSSLVDGKPVAETRTVDNVLANETRAPKTQRGSVMANLGMFGTTSLGETSAASAGFDVGIGYRAGAFGLTSSGRLGGIGSSENKVSTASLDLGGRLYIGESDIAPFVGAGFAVSYFHLSRETQGELKGSGASAFTTVGVEALRSHHMGLVVAARLDLPFYELEGSNYNPDLLRAEKVSAYTMPISLQVGLVFH
ncbi:MAG: hypothetical protein KIT84_39085 [Labilithrix sp.]|nr:hypothetical protein [Labilithrix sp.]MCW5817067.1 hypothetical protein [Labilithrix sp.]